MVPELNPEIIHKFRRKVNENNDFIRLFFYDYKAEDSIEGKDIWSKICSCMDWLTVSVEGIEQPEKNSDMNLASLKFTHFLVNIDMIVEAVNHLWQAIGQATNVKQPYINDRSIFNAREFERDYTDEKYFKEIRSWFGVHAVNGNVIDLAGFSKGVRFFSSWSSNLHNEEEFLINLYSNNRSAEEKYGGIKMVKIKDLLKFVGLRYDTLIKLMEEIDILYLKEKEILQKKPVQYDPKDTELKQLKLLYKQAKERRLTQEYYKYDIEKYISFLSCDLNEFNETDKPCVTKYLSALKPIIPAYYKIVQEIDDNEYEEFELLNLRSQTFRNEYHLSKVLEFASGGMNFSAGKIGLKMLIEKGLLPEYIVNLSRSCLYLLIHAIDHDVAR